MNRYLITICFIMSGMLASAHAGMYDDFLDNMVSCRALLVVLVFVHIVVGLVLRLKATKRNRYVIRYKYVLKNVVKKICKYPIVRVVSAWMLSSLALGIYLYLIAEQIFFIGIIVILVAWIPYIIVAAKRKWRRRFLTGYRAIYYYCQTLVIQIVGFIIYMVVCNFQWFKDALSYADYDGFGTVIIEPQSLEILRLYNGIVMVSMLFALAYIIPFIVFLAKRLKPYCKACFSK